MSVGCKRYKYFRYLALSVVYKLMNISLQKLATIQRIYVGKWSYGTLITRNYKQLQLALSVVII
jgi:hypothetical protein